MHQFKNDGSGMMPKWQRKLYIGIGLAMALGGILLVSLFGVTFGNVVQILCGVTIIWGVKFNGFYKSFRWYAEKQLKKKDNQWRNSRR